jgi:hypothetical protein
VRLDSSRIQGDFRFDYRQKGLLWFSMYRLAFEGEFGFQNPTTSEQVFEFCLPLPAEEAVYDGLDLSLGGKSLPPAIKGNQVTARAVVPGGTTGVLKATYHSQGQRTWRYRLGSGRPGATHLKMTFI